MTDVDSLDDLANAISNSSPKIKTYAQAQAAATQSQELDIRSTSAQLADAIARIEALENAPEPQPGVLPFAEAQLRPGYVEIKVQAGATDLGSSSVPVAGGNDVLLDFQNLTRSQAILIWTGNGQRVKGINCGEWNIPGPRTTSAYRRGGPRIRRAGSSGAEHVSLTGFTIRGEGLADGIAWDTAQSTKLTFQDFTITYPDRDVDEPNEHIDAIQCQGPVGRVEIGLANIGLCGVQAGNDRGKGIMLNRIDKQPFEVALRKVNFLAANLLTGAAIFQDYREIAIFLEDVWCSKQGPNGNVWASGSGLFYPQNWTSSGTAPNRVASWPAGTGITGVVKEGIGQFG